MENARPPKFLWQKSGPDAVKVHKWTGKNDYVTLWRLRVKFECVGLEVWGVGRGRVFRTK